MGQLNSLEEGKCVDPSEAQTAAPASVAAGHPPQLLSREVQHPLPAFGPQKGPRVPREDTRDEHGAEGTA